jgi:plasmid stability protein
MAVLTIRKIEDRVKERLQRQAQRNHRSMEQEVREILREAMNTKQPLQGRALRAEVASLLAKIKRLLELQRTASISQSKINRKKGKGTPKAKG